MTSPLTRRLSKKARAATQSVDGLQMAIANYNNPDRKLDNDQWRLVELQMPTFSTRPKGRILIPDPHIPRDRTQINLQHLNRELYSENCKMLEVSEHIETGSGLAQPKINAMLRRCGYKVRSIIEKVEKGKPEPDDKV